jgi:hypothetical protein
MTIASTLNAQQYPCNGITIQFSYPNKIFAAADLVVTLIDTVGTLYPFVNFNNAATGLNYTIQNVDVDTGCLLIMSAPPSSGWTLDVRSLIAEVQTTSVKNQGSFLPELHEEAFDRLTREIQDLLRLSYTYGIHGPDIESTPWPALPNALARRGQALMFDGTTGLPTLGTPVSSTLTQGLFNTFFAGVPSYVQTAAEIAASVVPSNFFYFEGDLRRYGGVGNGSTDDSIPWQKAISVGIARIPKGFSFKIVTPATKTGQVTILGEGKSSKLLCDGLVATITNGTGSFVDNVWLENITAPWIITRNPANWTASVAGTLQQSNTVLGYQPTSNDTDIWGSLTAPQQNQQIGPVLNFTGIASNITISRIYGRFVQCIIKDASNSIIQDCDIRGGKGVWGALQFDNATNQVQRGTGNKAFNNRVQYGSFSGVYFSSNDAFTCANNECFRCGESGTKTLQTVGVVFTGSVGGATSGTVSVGSVTNGSWTFLFSDGETRTATVTGTAVTWSGALVATRILTAAAYQGAINPQCTLGKITDNHCYQNYYDGIDAASTFSTTVDAARTHHQVIGNFAYNNGGDGINADGSFNHYTGNTLYNNQRFGFWGVCSNSLISGNTCVSNNVVNDASTADLLGGLQGNLITDNYIVMSATLGFPIYAAQVAGDTPHVISGNTTFNGTNFYGVPGSIIPVTQDNIDSGTGALTTQSFVLIIQNNGGTIQHKIIDDATGLGLGNYTSRIINASIGFTNSPSVDSTHNFAAGGGIVAAATSQFLFDTAPQAPVNDQMVAVLENNSSGTALNVSCLLSNLNVNGVTRTRLVYQFGNTSTDAAFALTGLALNAYIKVRFYGKIA